MPEYDLMGLAQSEISYFLTELDTPDWPLDELARDALLESGVGLESRWSYSPAGDLLSLVDAGGHRRRFGYTVAGQLKEGWLQPANNPAPGKCLVHDIRYNPSNQVERETAGNGVITEAEYAPSDGRLLRLAAGLPGASSLQDLSYEVDAVGNIVGIKDHSLPVRFFKNQRIEALRTFDYDSLGQLIGATGWEAQQTAAYPVTRYRPPNNANAVLNYREEYDYDPAGNMTELRHLGAQPFTRSWAVAANSNRSLLEDDQPPDFDNHFDRNGNLRFLQRGQAMTWDLRNQLTSVSPVQRESEADDTERYLYGGGGKRLRKVRTALTDARTVTSEVRYLPGLEIHLRNGAPTHQVLDLEAGRNRVKWLQGPQAPTFALRYHLTDHLGSGTLELDDHANVQSREAYYPFGGTAWEDHSDQSGAWKTLRYSGKERDATGLYYYGYRYFAPWMSRWINPDPAGAVDGLNLYGFVGNSPVGRVDLDGRMMSPTDEVDEILSKERDPAQVDLMVKELASLPVDLNQKPRSPESHVPGPSAVVSGASKDHTCPTCSKAFTRRYHLTRHLPIHTGEKRHQCKFPECGKAFSQRSHLTVHQRFHTGEKRHQCEFPGCGKAFPQKAHLTVHQRTHTGEKPHHCEHPGCGEAFARKEHLELHMRTHTDEKPYSCMEPGCGKAFSKKNNRDRHAWTHRPKESCPVEGCPAMFSAPSVMKSHIKKKHPEWQPST
jgi:insecticidal toxin complex protein TccC